VTVIYIYRSCRRHVGGITAATTAAAAKRPKLRSHVCLDLTPFGIHSPRIS